MIYYDNDWRKYIYAVCNEYGVPILTLKESDSIKDLKKERKGCLLKLKKRSYFILRNI